MANKADHKKQFRIAHDKGSSRYSIEFSEDGRRWMAGLFLLNQKQAQVHLERLRQRGCAVREGIA